MPSLRARGLTAPTLAAFAVVLALVAGMFTLLVAAVRSMDGDVATSRQAGVVLEASGRLERAVVDVETGLRGYLLTGDPEILQPFDEGRAALPGQEADVQRRLSDPAQRRRFAALRHSIDAYVYGYADPLRRGGPKLDHDGVVMSTREGKRQVDAVRDRFAAFNAAEQRLAARGREGVDAAHAPDAGDRRRRARRLCAPARPARRWRCSGSCSAGAPGRRGRPPARGRPRRRARAADRPRRGRRCSAPRSTAWPRR